MMKMKFMIRQASLEDAYEYAACHVSSWQSAYKSIIPDEVLDNLSIEQRAERFKQNFNEREDNSRYCAICGDRIVGLLGIGKSRDEDKPDAGEVYGIYLIEEFWGKGYGRDMMNYAVDTLKGVGYNEVILWVLEENSRARRFYEKCNFVFDGTKKEIVIGKPLIEIRYALNL